jgi:hypothetical protein
MVMLIKCFAADDDVYEVKFSLWHCAKGIGGMEARLHAFLTSAVDYMCDLLSLISSMLIIKLHVK